MTVYLPIELLADFMPAEQRDLIDDLARYENTKGLRLEICQRIMTVGQVRHFKKTVMHLLKLKPLQQAHAA